MRKILRKLFLAFLLACLPMLFVLPLEAGEMRIEEYPLLEMGMWIETIKTSVKGPVLKCGDYLTVVDIDGTEYVVYLFLAETPAEADNQITTLYSVLTPVYKFKPVINKKRDIPMAVTVLGLGNPMVFVEMNSRDYMKSSCLGLRS